MDTLAKQHSGALHILFYLGLALLACHELDAVFRHEWRILPGLSLLSDSIGRTTFILGHIPIFVLLFWLTGHQSKRVRIRSQLSIDAFLIVHAAAHYLMRHHPLYEFEPPVETITVFGGGLIGLVHAMLIWWNARAA